MAKQKQFDKACVDGDLEVAKRLIDNPQVNPAYNYNYAIRYASEVGHTKIVQLLLSDERINPAAKDNFCIIAATENGHLEVVTLLLKDKRVDPNDWKIGGGHDSLTKRTEGKHFSPFGTYRAPPIYSASINADIQMVKLLLSSGKINNSLVAIPYADYKYDRAISFASENGHTELERMLKRHKRFRLSRLLFFGVSAVIGYIFFLSLFNNM